MAHAAAARRLPVLAVVSLAHVLALALLIELSRTYRLSRLVEETLTLVSLQPVNPRPRPVPVPAPGPAPRTAPYQRSGRSTAATVEPGVASKPRSIDWAAEGADAAGRVARGEDSSRAPRTFDMPPPSPMFAPTPARRPSLPWDPARAHRVEVLPAGGVLFHINDHCVVGLLWIQPAFGCIIGKIPVRGDLLTPMRGLKEWDGEDFSLAPTPRPGAQR